MPFFLLANLLARFSELKNKKFSYGLILSVLLFGGIFAYNIYGLPLHSPNKQKDQVKGIVAFIIGKTDNKPFNFALITPGNSDYAYRYYFAVLGHPPVGIDNPMNDPQRKSVTNQLFTVCEGPKCEPLGYQSYEVAGFGRANILDQWNVSVVRVYKLGHYTGN